MAEYVLIQRGDALWNDLSQDGWYLMSFDVDAYDGIGEVEWTPNHREALRFSSFIEAMETWQTQSNVRPLRDDGKPNRPLTAWHVEPSAWHWDQPDCDICGEALGGPNAEVGEFYDPQATDTSVEGHKIAHAQCGLDAGLEIA
jgi:hypothetical protein